jgi:hypothetical protein
MPPRTGTTLAWRGNRKAHSPMTSQAMLSQLTVGHPVTPAMEAVRRAMVGLLFGLHTVCFRIYLQPDHGLRSAA